jgi:hypothetical protein
MANAPSAKVKAGQQKLLTFYVGLTESKSLQGGKATKHTHYVLIDEKKALRLGTKGKGTVKPGSDAKVNGIIIQTGKKKSTGDKKSFEAKRYITQYSKSITAFCKGRVKNSKGKDVQETYSIGFPSNVPIRLIIEFFKKNCPNVVRIGTGGQLYQVR